jgi:hypothetical protein
MSETLTIGATLARLFYDEHPAEFAAAASASSLEGRHFILSSAAFDDWLVAQGVLIAPATDFNSNSVERRGIVYRRNEARMRLNTYALKAEDFPAFTVGAAKNGRLKVRLLTLYAQEAPKEISDRVRASTRHHKRVIGHAIKLMDRSAHVRVEDRAAMRAFSHLMIPMLEAFSTALIEAMDGAEKARQREARKALKG